MYSIYKITNTVNGKAYIGMTGRGVQSRFSQHIRDARNYGKCVLHRAMNRHGHQSFTIETIDSAKSEKEAFDKEVRLIAELSTFAPKGYNMTKGGDGVVVLCEESTARKTAKAFAQHADPRRKRKHLEGIKAFWASDRTDANRAATSKAHKGKRQPEHVLRAAAEAKKNPEYIAALKQRTKEQWEVEGFRDKFAAAKREKHAAKAKRFPYSVDLGMLFLSTRDAARYMMALGFDKAASNNICLACRGKYKTSYGSEWRWMERPEMEELQIEPIHVP